MQIKAMTTSTNSERIYGLISGDKIVAWNPTTDETVKSSDNRFQITNESESAWTPKIALSPDETQIAIIDEKGNLALWDSKTMKRRLEIPLDNCTAITFSKDGALLIVGRAVPGEGSGSEIKVYQAATGRELKSISVDWNNISNLGVTNDQRLISSGGAGEDGEYVSTSIWDLRTGKQIKTFNFLASAISSDGKVMISNAKQIITVRDGVTGEVLRTIPAPFQHLDTSILSSRGRYLALKDHFTSALSVLDTQTGKTVISIPGDRKNRVSLCEISQDEQFLLFKQQSPGAIKLWNLVQGKEIHSLEGHSWMSGMALSPDGKTIVRGTGTFPGHLTVWDFESGKAKTVDDNAGAFIAYSPDGKWLAEGFNRDYKLKVLDTTNWSQTALDPSSDKLSTVHVAFGGSEAPSQALVSSGVHWFKLGKEPAQRYVFGSSDPFSISLEKQLLAIQPQSSRNVVIWNLKTGQILQTLSSKFVRNVSRPTFNPTGQQMATLSLYSDPPNYSITHAVLLLWNTEKWNEKLIFSSDQGSSLLAFHPTGKWIAAQPLKSEIQIFDAASGAKLKSFSLPDSDQYLDLAFSPDGKWLLVGSRTKILLWKFNLD